MNISDRIRQVRQTRGYSQMYMAEQLDMSQSNYHKIENAEVKIKVEDLLQIAKTLETDVNDLLKDQESLHQLRQRHQHQTAESELAEGIPRRERSLYEQLLQDKNAVILGKEEVIRSKDAQLAQLNERLTELLAEFKRLKGE